MQILGYGNNKTYDELFSSGKARSGLGELSKFLKSKTPAELNALRHDKIAWYQFHRVLAGPEH